MNYLALHQDYFFYALAGICLMLEIGLLGMSGPLLFVALGSLLAGLTLSLGLVHSFSIAMVLAAGLSMASAALLWGPLKNLQNRPLKPETSSDMVGKILPVSARITLSEGRVFYSGVDWLAQLDDAHSEPIEVHSRVEVTSVDGTLLRVRLPKAEADA
jgi:membrane protein implicated in regulation of membrane protease activity